MKRKGLKGLYATWMSDSSRGMLATRTTKARSLTTRSGFVTINPIRGDKETRVEFQPYLNSGLWPVYLTECDMRYVEPPTDGRQEAPGALPQNDE